MGPYGKEAPGEGPDWTRSLTDILHSWGLSLSPTAQEAFRIYLKRLAEANRRLNLTAMQEESAVALYHFADSLAIVPWLPSGFSPYFLDIGSGAGFPGLCLKIFKPQWRGVLLESVRKKCDFLRPLLRELGVTGLEAVRAHSKDLRRDPAWKESFSLVLARALAPPQKAFRLGWPFVGPSGFLALYETEAAQSKLPAAVRLCQGLGGNLAGVHRYRLPGLKWERQIWFFKKMQSKNLQSSIGDQP
ncbi:MAG: 16S rRNA (guanine(527)-N(7))-methyltransferase RsmG [Elusimicrobia bacterium]|nr:16S rRNA (guanine(527)-N(7))-methyltransferase RsmG [Elusimicrobiota bacterium]